MNIFDLGKFAGVSPLATYTTLLVLFLGILYYFFRGKDTGIPPGPWGLPFLGYWPFLKDQAPHIQLQELTKKYGDVYSFTVMGYLYIHLGTLKAYKEANLIRADCFTERYSDFSLLKFLFGEGVACSNGEQWRVTRKFFIQIFREIGLTSMKDYMTGPIYDSLLSTVENLKAAGKKPINIVDVMTFHCSGIMRRIMFGDEGVTESEMKELLEAYQNVLSITSGSKILLQGEFARRVIFPLSKNYGLASANHKKMINILKNIMKRHEESFDKDNVRDLIDSFIKERNEKRSKNDPSAKYFTGDILVSNLIQFVGDGILGVTIFIAYFFYALLEYPEEQDKIFKELEEMVGPDRQPTLEDRSKLLYTNAFMLEVNRTTDFFVLSPGLVCTKETTIQGYRIPKGAVTAINLWAAQRDPRVFEDPDVFKPSRYLNKPGKPKAEVPPIFGIGRRTCIGEAFTMMEVYLFLTTIVKNFRLIATAGFNKNNFRYGKLEVIAQPRK